MVLKITDGGAANETHKRIDELCDWLAKRAIVVYLHGRESVIAHTVPSRLIT